MVADVYHWKLVLQHVSFDNLIPVQGVQTFYDFHVMTVNKFMYISYYVHYKYINIMINKGGLFPVLYQLNTKHLMSTGGFPSSFYTFFY